MLPQQWEPSSYILRPVAGGHVKANFIDIKIQNKFCPGVVNTVPSKRKVTLMVPHACPRFIDILVSGKSL